MKIGLIPPIPNLKDIPETGFHLILAHLLSDARYMNFYKQRSRTGDYLVLDNGAHELGASRGHEDLLSDAKELGVNEIVLPDVLFDRRATIERTKRMLKWINTPKGFYAYEAANCPRLMIVPQGTDRADWAVCLTSLLDLIPRYWVPEMGNIVIGVSKDYDDLRGGLSYLIEHYIVPLQQQWQFDIHLLGWPRNLWSLAHVARDFKWIRSTDSARPFVYAKHGILLEPGGVIPDYPKRDVGYFSEEISGDNWEIAKRNGYVFRAAANNALILKV